MEKLQEVRETITKEITSDDPEVRSEYLKHFGGQVEKFTNGMAHAFMNWRRLDAGVNEDVKLAHISALVYGAITLHILSMKLFLSGYPVASGNLFRQTAESIALALLCSGRHLGVLEKFIEEKYSANKAISHVIRHAKHLELNEDALLALRKTQEFYHNYSHFSLLTIASFLSLSQEGLYVGPAFDEGKIKPYEKEIIARVGLAEVFPTFIDAVNANIAKW